MENNDKKTLGGLIKEARFKKFPNATVKAVAKAMGLSQSGLSHIENHGSRPLHSSCVKIARVLGIDERKLLILAGHIVVTEEDPPIIGKPDVIEEIEPPRLKPRNRFGLFDPQDKNEIKTTRVANAEMDALITGFALRVKAWRLRYMEKGAYDTVACEAQMRELQDTLEFRMMQES